MAQTKKTGEKDLISRLAAAGEDAISRLGDLPGGKSMVEAAHSFREALDDIAVRLRSLDPLEKRVAELEKRLEALERKGRQTNRRAPARPHST